MNCILQPSGFMTCSFKIYTQQVKSVGPHPLCLKVSEENLGVFLNCTVIIIFIYIYTAIFFAINKPKEIHTTLYFIVKDTQRPNFQGDQSLPMQHPLVLLLTYRYYTLYRFDCLSHQCGIQITKFNVFGPDCNQSLFLWSAVN